MLARVYYLDLMQITDYLLAQSGTDWRMLLNDWIPPLPPRFNLWLVNLLGDVFVIGPDHAVLRLDVGSGDCVVVAHSREHFAQLLDDGAHANEWLRLELVDACRSAGMTLGRQECYGFRIPPALGGRYQVANLVPTHLAVHYSFQAYICRQKDVYWIAPV
jgi:hypothetical protein